MLFVGFVEIVKVTSKMKLVAATVFSFLFIASCAAFLRKAEKCNPETCSSGDCRCSSFKSPLSEGNAPQLISLTFDESVVADTFVNLWQPLFFERKNPDGKPISGTFFVPHEYTDYKRVQDLYVQGFEIGINSITKNSLSQYWANATQDTLVQEFQGQRTIITTFANIPEEDLIGGRTPQLQINGDTTINAYIESGLKYDSSWTSRSTQLYFPYTLDYLSTQECRLGTTCPTDAHPGFWVLPIIDLQGNSSTAQGILECSNLNSCHIQGTASEISDWLLSQLDRVRSGSRAPLTLIVPSAWFRTTENSYEAFEKFLDAVSSFNDVFLVSLKQVFDWMKNPVPLNQFQTEVSERTADCLNLNCALLNANGDLRYMRSCVPCPEVYPWLGNPLGEAS